MRTKTKTARSGRAAVRRERAGEWSSAKIAPPRLVNAYARTRRFREFDRALRQPVVWIVAPAGYGETTLRREQQRTLAAQAARIEALDAERRTLAARIEVLEAQAASVAVR